MLVTIRLKNSIATIPLKHDPVKAVELLADNSRYRLINAVTAASKIAKSYERATDLERIGSEILALHVPQNFFRLALRNDSP